MLKHLSLPLTSEQLDLLAMFCAGHYKIDLDPQSNDDGTFYVDLSNPADEVAIPLETATFRTEEEATAFVDVCRAEAPDNSGRLFSGQPRPYLLKAGYGWKLAAGHGVMFPYQQFEGVEAAEEEALNWTAKLVEQYYGDQKRPPGRGCPSATFGRLVRDCSPSSTSPCPTSSLHLTCWPTSST